MSVSVLNVTKLFFSVDVVPLSPQMGISNDTHVVVYDNNSSFGMYSAGRVWWMFKVCHMYYIVSSGNDWVKSVVESDECLRWEFVPHYIISSE